VAVPLERCVVVCDAPVGFASYELCACGRNPTYISKVFSGEPGRLQHANPQQDQLAADHEPEAVRKRLTTKVKASALPDAVLGGLMAA